MDRRCRPALLARFGDLTSLRYDYPLVLNREGTPGRAVLSLSKLVDDAVENLGESPDRDRTARHGYQIEREIRQELASNGTGDFATLWTDAVSRLASGDSNIEASARQLWEQFHAGGDLVDADSELPSRLVRHAWSVMQSEKVRTFRQKAERLLQKLHDIIEAEFIGSAAGRTPEMLRAGVGASFIATFDFDAFSQILNEAKPDVRLSVERRKRVLHLIDVLERQRFYPFGTESGEPYRYVFDRCSDALQAYQERNAEAVELLKALAMAELEANGDYRESVHDVLFESFGINGLDIDELAKLPDYLVCINGETLDPAEIARIVESLAAGLPIRILVQTDEVLERSAIVNGHLALNLRSRQLVDTAISLTDVFVLQSAASHLFRTRESLMRGLAFVGPSLFIVFSGASKYCSDHPAYLVAAAAMESRAFPSMIYDPSAGPDRAARLIIDHNPASADDWPVHTFEYEDEDLNARSEKLAFTLADFMAMDDRFFGHFALITKTDWSDAMISISQSLPQRNTDDFYDEVPYVMLVDDERRLQRALVDQRTIREVRRCLDFWHSLQELGGIHNSHAERLLAEERKDNAEASSRIDERPVAVPAVAEPAISAEDSVQERFDTEINGDDPHIETDRCTSCNECTQLNNKMFAYNENKQAYIADASAGTFRQLVEAAEGCQVSIIHPGKPLNPKEPGLDDLLKRAADFN
jgi:hypothetical protein